MNKKEKKNQCFTDVSDYQMKLSVFLTVFVKKLLPGIFKLNHCTLVVYDYFKRNYRLVFFIL